MAAVGLTIALCLLVGAVYSMRHFAQPGMYRHNIVVDFVARHFDWVRG
jgi:hypothetical protein